MATKSRRSSVVLGRALVVCPLPMRLCPTSSRWLGVIQTRQSHARATNARGTIAGKESKKKQDARPAEDGESVKQAGLGVVTRERFRKAVERTSATWILGLDINTHSTGFTVLRASTGALVESGVIATSSIPDLFGKAMFLRQHLANLRSKYSSSAAQPDDARHPPTISREGTKWIVGIEDSLKGFRGIQWRTTDIMRLACLNTLVSYECWHIFFPADVDSTSSLESGPADDEFAISHLQPHSVKVDDEAEDDEFADQGSLRPIKVHPSQVKAYFGLRKRSPEDNIKEMGFDRVKHLFPTDHPWIVKRTGRLSDKNYDMVDSFMIAHYARRQSTEAALYNDERLYAEFEAAWMTRNQTAIESLRPRPDQAEAHQDEEEPNETASAKRSRKAAARRAEKKWRQEVNERVRVAFKKAISAAADAALPAP